MVIVFYDLKNQKIYVCSQTERMKEISAGDPNLMDYIPNDDILYVDKAHVLTKSQFNEWINGDIEITAPIEQKHEKIATSNKLSGKLFIHPRHHGSILIQDIQHEMFPNGVIELNGKWDFLPIDEIKDILEESMHYKNLLAKRKIEIVDIDYVKKNMHKKKQSTSAAEVELNRILIPVGKSGTAEAVAAAGGIDNVQYDGIIPIEVE